MFDKYCYKGYIYEASKELELDVPDIHEKIQKLIDEIIVLEITPLVDN